LILGDFLFVCFSPALLPLISRFSFRMKVFLDTNVWLSATIFAGLCEELVIQCAERGSLLTSELVRAEAHEVLQRKFPHLSHACDLFDASWRVAERVSDVAEPAHDHDRRLVNAAAAAGADLFVTGDKRVLSWKPMPRATGQLRMVSVREAWGLLQGGSASAH
jgi:predicted nucleic acid-binding protein